MKIGDRVFVRGYIDEIRKDTVIIRNAGGYFGTIPSEVITGELPSAQPQQKTGKWLDNPITAHSLAKHCSRCGYVCLGYDSITGARFQYCPSCGALMGGKNDEDD